jgi:hypothetical protein
LLELFPPVSDHRGVHTIVRTASNLCGAATVCVLLALFVCEVGGERKGACEGRSTNRYGKVDVREGMRADGRARIGKKGARVGKKGARIGKKGARIGKKGWTRSMPCGSCYTWYQITADICIGPMV